MLRMRGIGMVLLALLLGGAPGPDHAGAAETDLARFLGTYVGVAEVHDLATGERRTRDMDIVIEPFGHDGLRVHWVNVSRVDGRRDVPGVERRAQTVLLERVSGRDMLIEVSEGNPFREREAMRPMQGDPVRWAAIDDERLHVYSFVVREDGRYELQIYDRTLTEIGLDVHFERIVDGEVVRRITGRTVRTETTSGPE